MNPPVKLDKFFYNQMPFYVIRDDLLVGGTKQRALEKYLKSFDVKEFVYAGPDNGYAQIALAHVAGKLGKRVTVFAQSVPGKPSEPSLRATKYGANMIYVAADLKTTKAKAEKYVSQTPGSLLVPFGLVDDLYLKMLIEALKEATANILPPKRIWIPAGSGTLLRSIAAIWPHARILVVAIAKPIYWQDYSQELISRTKEYSAIKYYSLREAVRDEDTPPYPSLSTYDAKVWIFAQNELQPNDYIWNVGAD